MDVTHDARNDPVSKGEVKAEAQGILPGPVPTSERLADDGDGSDIIRVEFTEVPAGRQRDRQRFEEVRSGVSKDCSVGLASHIKAIDSHRPDSSSHDHRKETDVGGARHAWQASDLGQNLRVELRASGSGVVFRHRQLGPYSQHTLTAKTRIDVLALPQGPDQQTGRDKQDQRQRDLDNHQYGTEPLVSSADSGVSDFKKAFRASAARNTEGRYDPESESCQAGQHTGKDQHPKVKHGRIANRKGHRDEPCQKWQPHDGDQHAQGTSKKYQDKAFGKQLAHQPFPASADRRTNRQFLSPSQRPGKKEVRQVGTGDQQHTRRGSKERGQQQPGLFGNFISKKSYRRSGSGVCLGILKFQLPRDDRHLGPGCLQRNIGFQPRYGLKVVVVPISKSWLPSCIGSQSAVSRLGK